MGVCLDISHDSSSQLILEKYDVDVDNEDGDGEDDEDGDGEDDEDGDGEDDEDDEDDNNVDDVFMLQP